ncbi:MAG: flagellar hook protein FlgE [Comamonadaceae bacterium]|jgi:flagellar hook protein FlgE|nr:flagellar hook protein FlgE [Rhodoferax sp.]TSA15107.1 MAG: flagellar hook protein FlgE [Comamonadaceae bacterium]
MSFQQGLSGLNAAAKNLDVIGNNVANSNTAGFKQAYAVFGDVFAASFGGVTNTQVGIGTQIKGVKQEFSQGNITVTNNPLDVAINGLGFLRMSDSGAISYTRNGGFSLDKTGFIVGAGGQHVTGYTAVNGTIVPNVLVNLQLSAADLPPTATTNASVGVSLTPSAQILPTASLLITDPATYNFSTASSAFDTLGKAHPMSFYFNKTAANTWDCSTYVDGVVANGVGPSTLTFDSAGALLTSTNLAKTATPAGGAAPLSITLNFDTMTQFASSFGVNSLSLDGAAAGALNGYNVGADGIIMGKYTNGQTQRLGQIVLTNFTNIQGLAPAGDGMWIETADSGVPLTGIPGSASLGALQSSAKEDSNVDLTAELVAMITAQRVYQANAQSIKTQDQLLQTMVNLK